MQQGFSQSVTAPSLRSFFSCPALYNTQRLSPPLTLLPLQLASPVSCLLLPHSFYLHFSPDLHTAFFADISLHYKTAIKSPLSFGINIKLPLAKDAPPAISQGFSQAVDSYPHIKCSVCVSSAVDGQCCMTEAVSPTSETFQKRLGLTFSGPPFCCMRLGLCGGVMPSTQHPPSHPFTPWYFLGLITRKLPLAFKA